jgi:hypothetical protein
MGFYALDVGLGLATDAPWEAFLSWVFGVRFAILLAIAARSKAKRACSGRKPR